MKFKNPGYTGVRNRIDFGTKRKPDVKFTYYDLKKIKKERFNIYFAGPCIFENGTLYDGNHKIGQIQVNPKKNKKVSDYAFLASCCCTGVFRGMVPKT